MRVTASVAIPLSRAGRRCLRQTDPRERKKANVAEILSNLWNSVAADDGDDESSATMPERLQLVHLAPGAFVRIVPASNLLCLAAWLVRRDVAPLRPIWV